MAFGVRDLERVSTTFANELLIAVFVVAIFVDWGTTFRAYWSLHSGTPPLLRYGGGGWLPFLRMILRFDRFSILLVNRTPRRSGDLSFDV